MFLMYKINSRCKILIICKLQSRQKSSLSCTDKKNFVQLQDLLPNPLKNYICIELQFKKDAKNPHKLTVDVSKALKS